MHPVVSCPGVTQSTAKKLRDVVGAAISMLIKGRHIKSTIRKVVDILQGLLTPPLCPILKTNNVLYTPTVSVGSKLINSHLLNYLFANMYKLSLKRIRAVGTLNQKPILEFE